MHIPRTNFFRHGTTRLNLTTQCGLPPNHLAEKVMMDKEDLKADWLSSNALVALVGALLMGQTWQKSEGTVTVFCTFTVPNYWGCITLTVILLLFVVSIVFALGSLFSKVSKWEKFKAFFFWPGWGILLGVLVWVSFMLSWSSLRPEPPENGWWYLPLALGGLLLANIIVGVGIYRSISRWGRSGIKATDTAFRD